MNSSSVEQFHKLVQLIDQLGESWLVNNTLERLAADELTLAQAIKLLEWFHYEIVTSIEHGS